MKDFFAILIVLCPLWIYAQENIIKEEEIIELSLEELLNLDVNVEVVSTKGDNIFQSPSAVTVIGKDEIERYNFISVAEALQTVAGFSVERTYLKRNLATGRGVLQDHYANKLLILINGIALWNAVTGEGSIDRVSIEDVERIEVLKGPASVLYGSNAYTGAVNIVLKKAKESSSNFHAGYGMHNSYEIGGNATAKKGDFETFLSLHSSSNHGPENKFIDELNDTGMFNDYLKAVNANVALKFKSHFIQSNIFSNKESHFGYIPRYSTGAGNPHLSEGLMLNYTFNHEINRRFNVKAGATYDYGKRDISRAANDSTRAKITGNRMNIFARANYIITDNVSIELGGDYEERFSKNYATYKIYNDSVSITDPNKMDNKKASEISGFGQFQFRYNQFTLLMGGRYTNSTVIGGTNLDSAINLTNFSPRITGVYSINEKNSVKLIYGESYRTPSLFENYFYNKTSVAGNQNLKPETAQSIELAYLTSFNRFFIQLLAYHSTYNGKIVRIIDTTGYAANVYTNGKTFSANGLEVELKYANPRIINAFLNVDYIIGNKGDAVSSNVIRKYTATYIDTIKAFESYNFYYVPKYNITFGAYKEIVKGFSFSTLLNYTAPRGAVKPSIDAQYTIDLNLIYEHHLGKSKITHILGCKNLTDNQWLMPEYSRLQLVNTFPYGTYRHIAYTLRVELK